MAAILIAKLIFALNTTQAIKQNISMCTFYGVKAGTVNLYERFESCKEEHLGER